MISLLIAAAASLGLALAPVAVQAASPWQASPSHRSALLPDGEAPFDGVVTFGDSLSDSGNAFVITGDFSVRPFEPVPSAPYLIGGFRFSNGPVWIEWLTRDLGLRRSGRPALLLPRIYTNYAIGGARARPPADPIDLSTEVDIFLEDFGDVAPSDMLYVLWIGSNDLRDAFVALGEDPAEAEQIVAAALQATGDNIIRLYLGGARSFLVLNLPNLAITPAINTLAPGVRAAAELLSVQYNANLEEALLGLEALLDIDIARLNVFGILNEAVADPASVGLVNVTDSCITPGVIVGAICRRPDTYLFWDFIHPTTKSHRILAQRAEESLTATFEDFEPAASLVSSR
jgi:phospholipase/lecithinase/hemolysin